jgi:hypothetical protein
MLYHTLCTPKSGQMIALFKLAAVNHVRHHGKTRKQSLTIFLLRKIYLASANLMLLKLVKLHDSYNNSKKAVLVRMSSLL